MRARMASICRFSTVEEMTPNWTRVFVLSLDLCRISDTGNACSVWCVQFHLLEYEQETRWIQFASLSFTLSFQHHVHLQLRGRTQRTHQTLFRSVQSARQRHSHHLRVGTFFLPFGCWETPFVGFFVQPWFRCPSIFFAHHFFFLSPMDWYEAGLRSIEAGPPGRFRWQRWTRGRSNCKPLVLSVCGSISLNCQEDWVEIYNVFPGNKEYLLGRYCGNSAPGPVESIKGAIGLKVRFSLSFFLLSFCFHLAH